MKMKRAKKPVSLLLSVVMMLSLCSTSALAEDSLEEEPSVPEIVQEQTESVDEPDAAPEEDEYTAEPDAEAAAEEADVPDTEEPADSELTPDEEEAADPGDADAEESEEEEEPEETDESEEAEEEEESEISLLAADDPAPETYEVTVVYFDENNDRITYSPAETMELTTGSVTTALEDASLQTRTYGSREYKLDWVYNSKNQKVADVTYVKDTNGDWQLSYSLTDNAIAGVVGDDLEIWYTYDTGALPVSYSPSKADADGSMNYIDGDTIIMPGSELEFYVYADRGYSYIPSVTAGSTSLPIKSVTATSKTESGETVYITEGEFKVDVPADITNPIVVTAAYSPIKTVTFSPKGFSGQHISDISNNGQNNLDDVSKEYSEDGVDFTFEFSTNDGYLSYLQINGVTCVMPSTLTSGEFKDSATTTIIKDPSGDSEKDCTATISNQHTEYSESCRTTITISHAKEDITITGAKIRGRWDAEVMVIAGEGVACQNRSTKSDGDADTTKVGEPMEATSYREIQYVFGIEKWYKDLTFELDLFHSTGEQEAKETIDLSKVTTSGERIVLNEHTFATVYKDEDAGEEYQYRVTFTTEEGDYQHGHIYFLQLHLTCEPEKFNVEYELNGGTGTIQDDTVYTIANAYANVTLAEPTPPEGKLFYAWTTDDPAGKEVSDLNLLYGGQDMDLVGPAYQELMNDKTPTKGFDGTLTLYAVYVDELPEGTSGTAVVKTYLQDSTGAYAPSGSDQNVDITVGQSLTVYDSYINGNPNVNYNYYTYNANASNPYLAKTTGNGDEIRLYYDLQFTGSVTQSDWTYGDNAKDPSPVLTVTDGSGATSTSTSNSQVGKEYIPTYVYYQANDDGSQGETLDGVPTVAGNYIVEASWTYQFTVLDENGAEKSVTVSIPSATTTFTISQRDIILTANSNSKDFDGTPLTDSGYTISGDGLASGDSVASITVSGSQTAVGSSDNTISDVKISNSAGEDMTDSYNPSYVSGTLTVNPGTTQFTVTIVWDDNSDQDGIRPDVINVQLLADGVAYGNSVSMSETGDTWTYTWKKLNKAVDDHYIDYAIAEITAITGYQTTYETSDGGVTITNAHTPEIIDISGSKTWVDDDNRDRVRPESITIFLKADGDLIQNLTVEPDDQGNWTWDFTDLPKYDAGQEIKYKIMENVPEGYEATYDGYDITNTHPNDTTSISVSKTWKDNHDQDGLRPDRVTVQLYADGNPVEGQTLELNESNDWTGTFSGLDLYEDQGEKIQYTVTEVEVPEGYEASVNQDFEDSATSFTITNTHTPETYDIKVDMVWDDADDQDGVRPDEVTVTLYADGKKHASKTISADENGNWTCSFSDVPKYQNGKEITYTIVEDEDDIDGYTGTVTGDAQDGFTITNTHTPETISISGTKTWDDAEDQDGIRPDAVTLNVLADGSPALDENGTAITVTVTAEENWTWSVSDLPKYRAQGKTISYTVLEDAVTGYKSQVTGNVTSGFVVTNSHTPDLTTVSVSKVWDDADDQDGIRPDSVTVSLLVDGADSGKTVTLEEANSWSDTFTGLDVYHDQGKTYDYTVEEADMPEGYEASVTGEMSSGYTMTNTHTPEQISVTVTKAWDDADDQDGIRPDSVTVKLLADGKDTGKTVILNASNQWTSAFTGMDQYEGQGKEVQYSVEEETVPDGYTAAVTGDASTGYTVTNTHTPETVEIDVDKIWDDADDQDGKRPDSITVNLLADGKQTESATVKADRYGEWGWSFNDLPKYRDEGTEIVYTITEDSVTDYNEPAITGDAENGFEIYNTHTPETITIEGHKTWEDDNNNDGVRPASITIRLKADGSPALDSNGNEITATVTEEEDWGWAFLNLPKYEAGKEISYTITEDAVDHYATTYDTYNVTNSHTPDQTSLTVSVAWDDSKDQDGIRPESVTLKLLADGVETGQTVTLSADNNWTSTFTELDIYEDQGEKIQYTVEEASVPDGYTVSITGNATTGYTVTDSHTPETIEINATKFWLDADDQDGKRPEQITINLLADDKVSQSVTVTAADDWRWNFTDLPKYRDEGIEIVYTVDEDPVADYNEPNITGDVENGFKISNIHTAETMQITVDKIWDDADDQDGIRPTSITVNLLVDGADSGKTVTLEAANNWSDTFTALAVYHDQGETYTYTVEEADVPDGYETSVTGDAASGYTITNTHTPETLEIDVDKIWDDADDQDGKRPTSITVNLLADGKQADSATVTADRYGDWGWSFNDLPKYRDEGTEIVYTITEDPVSDYDEPDITGDVENGFEIYNTHTPETIAIEGRKTWDDDDNNDGNRPASITIRLKADGSPALDTEGNEITATVTEAEDWSWKFPDLPKYDAGKEITYTITEDAVDHYATTYESYNVTNTHTPDQTSLTVSVAWDDNKNQDGLRPASITLKLLADGEDTGQTVVLSASNNWTSTFTGLDMYEDQGEKIQYTVEEVTVPDGYTVAITGDATTGYTVTDTHTPETIEISGSKTWDDDDNNDGDRPESITIRLLADDKESQSVTVTAADDWSWNFMDLPKYEDGGTEVIYTVTEDAVPQYATTYDGDNVTNTHTPDQTSLTVNKVWDDKNDQDGIRPASVTVKLLADGEDTGETLTLTASNSWKGTFSGLDIYEDQGEEIQYTVKEENVPTGYEAAVTGDAATGYTVTNTHTPETVTISGSKNWNDDNNNDGDRPDAITIRLKADGADTDDIIVTADDDWSWSFTDLPKYKAGKEITYTVTEDAIDHYSTIYRTAYEEIVNVHTPDMTSLTVSAAWYDEDNQDGIRPDSVTVQLYANGEPVKGRTLVLSASDNWRGTFTGLDIFEDQGERIQYTVEVVDEFDGYESDVTGTAATGYTINFTHIPVMIDISGSKTWLDDNNNDGDRPDAITIRLLADGTAVDSMVVTPDEDGGWSWSFTGYDQYRDGGVEIVYTITEDAVDNYATNVHGYDVTNIHTPDQTSVTVTKVWDDLDDQDGIRPDNVTVKLLADGVDTGKTVLLGEANHWMAIFTGLDLYQDEGSRVVYTVEEAEVPDGYTASVSGDASAGYTITNSHETEIVTGPGPATGNPENGNPTKENPATVNPTGTKTGDPNNIALWIVLLLAAGSLAVVNRRRYRDRTK